MIISKKIRDQFRGNKYIFLDHHKNTVTNLYGAKIPYSYEEIAHYVGHITEKPNGFNLSKCRRFMKGKQYISVPDYSYVTSATCTEMFKTEEHTFLVFWTFMLSKPNKHGWEQRFFKDTQITGYSSFNEDGHTYAPCGIMLFSDKKVINLFLRVSGSRQTYEVYGWTQEKGMVPIDEILGSKSFLEKTKKFIYGQTGVPFNLHYYLGYFINSDEHGIFPGNGYGMYACHRYSMGDVDEYTEDCLNKMFPYDSDIRTYKGYGKSKICANFRYVGNLKSFLSRPVCVKRKLKTLLNPLNAFAEAASNNREELSRKDSSEKAKDIERWISQQNEEDPTGAVDARELRKRIRETFIKKELYNPDDTPYVQSGIVVRNGKFLVFLKNQDYGYVLNTETKKKYLISDGNVIPFRIDKYRPLTSSFRVIGDAHEVFKDSHFECFIDDPILRNEISRGVLDSVYIAAGNANKVTRAIFLLREAKYGNTVFLPERFLHILENRAESFAELCLKAGLFGLVNAFCYHRIVIHDKWTSQGTLSVHEGETNLQEMLGFRMGQIRILNEILLAKNDDVWAYSPDSVIRLFLRDATDEGKERTNDFYERMTRTIDDQTFRKIVYLGYSYTVTRLLEMLDSWRSSSGWRWSYRSHGSTITETSREVSRVYNGKSVRERVLFVERYSTCAEELGDYLSMRSQCEENNVSFDRERFPTFPKPSDVCRLHNDIMAIYSRYEEEAEKEALRAINEMYEKGPYKKAKKLEYSGTDESKYAIVAPKDVCELTVEGNMLHHCVGSYKDSVAHGREYILFLRKKESLDTPFFTIDITPEGVVRQIHCIRNGNIGGHPEEKELVQFLTEWTESNELVDKSSIRSSYGVLVHV